MLIRRRGMFGPIEVRDTLTEREVLLNGQPQGGSKLRPSAMVVDDELPEDAPGPVSCSAYPLGWLLAGVMNNPGSGLMIGLGSGAGATQLLYNFPQIDLTVVEIDPVMVEVALRAYPLLEWYMQRGQLNIVIEDAQKYLTRRPDVWDFACADAYTGGSALVSDYMDVLCDRADTIYVNCIDSLGGPSMRELTKVLNDHHKPPAELFKAIPFEYLGRTPFVGRSNWVITTQPVDWPLVSAWEPFAELEGPEGPEVLTVQRNWDAMLSQSALNFG